MPEQKGGRTRSQSKNISLKLSKRAVEMLEEIQEFTGTETTAEAVRACILDYYKRNIKREEKKPD